MERNCDFKAGHCPTTPLSYGNAAAVDEQTDNKVVLYLLALTLDTYINALETYMVYDKNLPLRVK